MEKPNEMHSMHHFVGGIDKGCCIYGDAILQILEK